MLELITTVFGFNCPLLLAPHGLSVQHLIPLKIKFTQISLRFVRTILDKAC